MPVTLGLGQSDVCTVSEDTDLAFNGLHYRTNNTFKIALGQKQT